MMTVMLMTILQQEQQVQVVVVVVVVVCSKHVLKLTPRIPRTVYRYF